VLLLLTYTIKKNGVIMLTVGVICAPHFFQTFVNRCCICTLNITVFIYIYIYIYDIHGNIVYGETPNNLVVEKSPQIQLNKVYASYNVSKYCQQNLFTRLSTQT
jgi:hypothetical protein